MKTLKDIENIVIKNSSKGNPILIRDVGKVNFGYAPRYGALTRNDDGEVVGGSVLMLKGENSAEVVKNVKEKIKRIENLLPEGVVIEPFLDRTKLVNSAIHTVIKNLTEGALIVIFVLVLLLGNLRAGLIVASVIPLSMLFAICLMNTFGVSGNLMSLGAIDFGLIVDGAVIIVEATLHHLRGLNSKQYLTQQEMDTEVYHSASKIRSSAAFGEIIILIVYLPILALVGIEGKMFKPMAQTVMFAILGAFILSLTYVPMISALLLNKKLVQQKKNISDRIIEFFQRVYDPLIKIALKRKALVVIVASGLFAVSLVMFLRMGGEFLPTLEEGDFAVETTLMTGASLSQSVETFQNASHILKSNFPEVKDVIGRIGTSEIPTDPMPFENGDLIIVLKDKEEWTSASSREELANLMKEKVEAIPGVEFGFQQPIQMRFNELISGVKQDVAIKIFGDDINVLAENALAIRNIIEPVMGVKDIYVEKVKGLSQIIIELDRSKIAQYGLTVSDVNKVIRTGFAGESAGVVFEGEKRFDLVVRLDEEARQDIEAVRQLYVSLPSGIQIPLEEIATINFQEGPAQISHEDTRRRITIGFNVRGRDVESTVNEIEEKLTTAYKLPQGYFITYGGQFQNLQEAKSRLSVAVPVALLLIFTLLYFTFGNLSQSLLIFTAIPLSAIGGVFALWLRGMPFSISAGVGFIALFGVAVLNGIVLISYFNQLKKEGVEDVTTRVLVGTKVRLRPVIMTALVASLGFLPMALSSTAGGEVQKPLATVVIGGLISATLLTLIVLPVLYVFLERRILNSKGDKVHHKKGNGTILLFMLAIFFQVPAFSQSQNAKPVSLNEATQIALQNNFSIKSANYEIDLQKINKKTSSDIGKTNFLLQYGQTNSVNRDSYFTISQNIPFPTVISNNAKLSRSRIESSKLQLKVTENELIYQVRIVYHQLTYLDAKRKLLIRQDSVLSNFVRASEIRYKTQETNLLEKITAQSQQMETKNLLAMNEADIRIYKNQLQTLLHTEDVITVSDRLRRIEPDFGIDSILISQNPSFLFSQQQINVAINSRNLERSRLLPDFTVGYFNQSLMGTEIINGQQEVIGPERRFTGIEVGVALPIWIRPQAARVAAARVSENIARSNAALFEKNIKGQLIQLFEQHEKNRKSLAYFESDALPVADLILESAEKSFKLGAIDYIEYTQALTRALVIRSNYLDALNSYNQSVLNIKFLLGR